MDVLSGLVESLETVSLEIQSGLARLWQWIQHVFLAPGDYVLTSLKTQAPVLLDSSGLNTDEYALVYAAVLSAGMWLAAVVMVKAVYRIIRDLLESLVYSLRNLAKAVAHRSRMARWRLRTPIRKLQQRFRTTKSVHLEEFDIDDLQLAILRMQSKLPPGHAITALDIANEFGVGQTRAQQALDTLRKLHLVEVAFGTTDGFPNYSLTRPGEVFAAAGDPA